MTDDDKLFVTIADLRRENGDLERQVSKYRALGQLAQVIAMLQGMMDDESERLYHRIFDAEYTMEKLEGRIAAGLEELARARAKIVELEQKLEVEINGGHPRPSQHPDGSRPIPGP